MNYFAHGRHWIDDPYFLAGTATPDWLNVVDRKVRVRSSRALAFVEHDDPHTAALARGVVQHHRDDDWFHQTRAFAELSLQLTVAIRDHLAPDDGFRPSFLGHILVELLLDAALIDEYPKQLDAYYQAIENLDRDAVAAAINRIATAPAERLPWFIERFSAERFLYDYLDDAKLLYRLNQVMRRVRLPALPESITEILSQAREQVYHRKDELLTGQSPTADRQP